MVSSTSARHLNDWVRRLGSKSPSRVEQAKEALAAAGQTAVPVLVHALELEDDTIRSHALSLLALLGTARTAAPITALLHDPSTRLRQRAAAALARIPSARAVTALSRLLEREESARVRWAAVRSLIQHVQTGHEEALGAVLARLADPEETARVRTAALDVAPWMVEGEDESAARSILGPLRKDRVVAVRRKAARMLEAPRLRARLEPWVQSRLLEELGSRKLSTWRRALTVLSRGGSEIVEPVLEALIARPERTYAERCVLVLQSRSSRQLSRLGPYLDSTWDPIVLDALLQLAGGSGSRSLLASVAGVIERLADAGDRRSPALDDVRQRAHLVLALAGSRMGAADLRDLLEDRATTIRPELVQAAEAIGTRHELIALLRAYRRSRGPTRLLLHQATLRVARRDGIRRTSRLVVALPDAERRAAQEILGVPNGRNRRPTGTPTINAPSLD